MFSWTVIANIIEGASQLVVFIAIGRFLNSSDYGVFSTVFMFSAIFYLCASFNIQMVINRAVSRDYDLASHYLGNGLAMLLISSGFTFLIAFIFARLIYNETIVILIIIFGFYRTCLNLAQLFIAVFSANRRMDYYALLTFINWSVAISLIFFFLRYRSDLALISLALVVGSLSQLLLAMGINRKKKFAPNLNLKFDITLWRKIIKEALPLGATQILGMTYWRVDTILLSILIPNSYSTIGLYSAAYTLLSGVNLIGRSVYLSSYPIFSRIKLDSSQKIRRIASYSILGVFGLGILAAIVLSVWGAPLLLILYGNQYNGATEYIKILAFSTVFTYISYLAYSFLPAIDRSEKYLFAVTAAAVINITLNLLLIPRLSAIACSLVTVITEFTVALLGAFFMLKYTSAKYLLPVSTQAAEK